ncbi:hypothetical protein PaG_00884 [Moesziomyces aphidis]|uniref:U6 snRNA phosphodiesterase 1 n=1 Tax=Moesziomyces aphidis TaxID=84754 RepID=W3VTU4_MOEAP|nr:hypothetical protein PaG_00884 [Moesziomyces aphidis]
MSGRSERLVSYSDSDSDETAPPLDQGILPVAQPTASDNDDLAKVAPPRGAHTHRIKRKLQPLDDDSLQQASRPAARDRVQDEPKTAYARGEWLCYCFVEVPMTPSLRTLIQESHSHVEQGLLQAFPDKACLLKTADAEESSETLLSTTGKLHISLTRPFTVRAHERDEYVKTALAEIGRFSTGMTSFSFSFSRIACLANDDASKHFMVLEVGPGRENLRKLSTALGAELHRAFRAKSYYQEARFHASTTCLSAPPSNDTDADMLASRFRALIDSVESEWGSKLRKLPPFRISRIGIQVANRITYAEV